MKKWMISRFEYAIIYQLLTLRKLFNLVVPQFSVFGNGVQYRNVCTYVLYKAPVII